MQKKKDDIPIRSRHPLLSRNPLTSGESLGSALNGLRINSEPSTSLSSFASISRDNTKQKGHALPAHRPNTRREQDQPHTYNQSTTETLFYSALHRQKCGAPLTAKEKDILARGPSGDGVGGIIESDHESDDESDGESDDESDGKPGVDELIQKALYEAPLKRELRNIDHLIRMSTDEEEIWELRLQKRLLRKHQPVQDARQKKKVHTNSPTTQVGSTYADDSSLYYESPGSKNGDFTGYDVDDDGEPLNVYMRPAEAERHARALRREQDRKRDFLESLKTGEARRAAQMLSSNGIDPSRLTTEQFRAFEKANPLTQSSLMSEFEQYPNMGNVARPMPVKKKLSLSDYISRRQKLAGEKSASNQKPSSSIPEDIKLPTSLRSAPNPLAKASDKVPVHYTISKDKTRGEAAAMACLFKDYGPKNMSPLCRPRPQNSRNEGFDEGDIRYVMDQARASRGMAIYALKENDGDRRRSVYSVKHHDAEID